MGFLLNFFICIVYFNCNMLGTNKVVLLLPYKSLTDSKLRELELQLEDAMRSTGMTVVDKSDCK